MRTLERFFHRRKIKDPNPWLVSMGITSHGQLVEWCKKNDVFEPADIYFGVPTVEASKKQSAKKSVAADEPDATWHTPAAERPRRSSKVKTSKTKHQTKK